MNLLKKIWNFIARLFKKRRSVFEIKKNQRRNQTHKQLRSAWLKKHGYTFGGSKALKKQITKQPVKGNRISHYMQQLEAYIKAKRNTPFQTYRNENNKIIRNRQGIPFYNVR